MPPRKQPHRQAKDPIPPVEVAKTCKVVLPRTTRAKATPKKTVRFSSNQRPVESRYSDTSGNRMNEQKRRRSSSPESELDYKRYRYSRQRYRDYSPRHRHRSSTSRYRRSPSSSSDSDRGYRRSRHRYHSSRRDEYRNYHRRDPSPYRHHRRSRSVHRSPVSSDVSPPAPVRESRRRTRSPPAARSARARSVVQQPATPKKKLTPAKRNVRSKSVSGPLTPTIPWMPNAPNYSASYLDNSRSQNVPPSTHNARINQGASTSTDNGPQNATPPPDAGLLQAQININQAALAEIDDLRQEMASVMLAFDRVLKEKESFRIKLTKTVEQLDNLKKKTQNKNQNRDGTDFNDHNQKIGGDGNQNQNDLGDANRKTDDDNDSNGPNQPGKNGNSGGHNSA